MKQGWEMKKLGDICDIVNGTTPLRTNKDFWEGGNFPWFTIDDIREQGRIINRTKQKVTQAALKKLRILPVDTILLCCTASIGEYAITKIELTTNQQFNGLVIKNKKEMFPMFLLYFSTTLKDTLSDLSGKATIDFIPISKLKDIEIPLPPFQEQQRIVAILGEAFAAIAKAKSNAEQNLKNSKELFESYLQGVFESKGEGWEEKTLGELSERVSVGHVGPTSEFYCDPSIGVPFIRSQNVRSGYLDWKGIQHITREFHQKLKKSQLKIGDILFVRVGANRGDCCILKENIKDLNCANIVLARLKEGNVDFIDRFCQSPIGKQQLLGMSVGAAQGVINTKSVAELIIPYPPIKEQKSIVEKIEILSAETKKLEAIYKQKINDLEQLKKAILKKAFNGELKTNALVV